MTLLRGLTALAVALTVSGMSLAQAQRTGHDVAVDAAGRFAWSTFPAVMQSAEEGKNVLYSPFSAYAVLSMVANGAEGETREEIKSALGYGAQDLQAVNGSLESLIRDLMATESEETLEIAHSVWGNAARFSFNQDFVATVNEYYKVNGEESVVHSASFADPGTLETVNQWVHDSTGGMIPTILDQLQPDWAAVLLNALFFKGQWLEPFEDRRTAEGEFLTAAGDSVTVPMMHSQKLFDFAEGDTYKILSLAFRTGTTSWHTPTGKGRYRVDFILPKGQGVQGLASTMDAETYEAMVEGLMEQPVDVALPKFKFSYKQLLNPILQDQGMVRAFTSQAQLGRLGEADGDLFLDKVLQRTAVEMDENGFKAAAVTAATVGITSAPGEPEVSFIADRPFLFVLRDSETGTILFQGMVVHPGATE